MLTMYRIRLSARIEFYQAAPGLVFLSAAALLNSLDLRRLSAYCRSSFRNAQFLCMSLSTPVLISYRRLYGYLKQNLVELSSQKSTRAERNPAAP